MPFQSKKILVTVKAYPNPSKKYGETVCCAGVDMDTKEWVRLFPIPYRDLDDPKQFKKYAVITVNCSKPTDDKRPESHHVDSDSIKVLDWWDTKDNWERRKSVVLKLPVKSMCQVLKDAEEKDLSLALIKPADIAFAWKKVSLSDPKAREECYAQLSFFNKQKQAIEEIPYDFYYTFKCGDVAGCPGHKLSIIDWEIGQAYRDWRSRYPEEKVLLEKIEQRWLDIANTEKKDVYFYVGNLKRFRQTFMVLGTFYPPK